MLRILHCTYVLTEIDHHQDAFWTVEGGFQPLFQLSLTYEIPAKDMFLEETYYP